MRSGFVSAILATLMGAALASAQQPPEPPGPLPPPTLEPVVPLPADAVPIDGLPEPVADGWVEDLRKSLRAQRFWVSGTYLYWWLSERGLPPLITRGATNDAVPGALGQAGTLVLFGGDAPDNNARSGARFHAGLALNSAYTLGLEGDFLVIPHNADRPSLPPSNPVVARPYLDATTGTPSAAIVSSPTLPGGGVTGVFSNALIGGELNLRAGLFRNPNWYVSMIAGGRYLKLDERVEVVETVPIVSTLPVFGADRVLTDDQFATRNSFFGGQLGLECEYAYERLRINVRGKVALGTTQETISIHGLTALANVAGPVASPPPVPSGLLALPTNIGNYSRDRFTALPEVGFSVGWCMSERLRLDVGYTLLYWAGVARVADQIDPVINPTQIPSALGLGTLTGPARPAFRFQQSELMVQGVNFTLEWRY